MKKAIPWIIAVLVILYVRGHLLDTGTLPTWCEHIQSGWNYFTDGLIE